MMRENYAIGSDDDMPPEIEDMPTDEYLELLKQLGAPVENQASGIRSLEKKTASMDANEKEFMRLVDEFMEDGFSLQEAIEEAKRELEEKSVRRKAPSIKMAFGPGYGDDTSYQDYMDDLEDGIISPDTTFNEWLQNNAPDPDMDLVRKRKAPSIKLAEYEPGNYDPLIVDEYEKYKYDAEEQGQPVMSIDEFLRMARSQAMGGGIMRTKFANAGSAEIYEPERLERQAEIREEKATDIPSRRKAKDLDLDIMKIKELIKKAKEEEQKRAKGGIAGVL